MKRAALALSAFLAGASGLALESVLVSSSGLALGYGGSTALGLATWLSFWAVGAWLSGRWRGGVARALVVLGLALALLAVPLVLALLAAGGALAANPLAPLVALACIALAGVLQGAFLPLFARVAAEHDPVHAGRAEVGVALLFAANLAGSMCGAILVADAATAAHGRLGAAACAGGLAAAAGWIGALCARRSTHTARENSTRVTSDVERAPREDWIAGWRAAVWIVAIATAWMSALEWIGLRLGVLWLGGMQPALSAVLAASLFALALGAAIVPVGVPRGARGVFVVLAACTLASLWPFAAASVMRALFARGAEASADLGDSTPILVRAIVLVGPMLVPFGALVPVLHRSFGLERESGRRLGDLLLCEAVGACVGIPLVHLWIVPRFGLSGAIAFVLALAVLAFVVSRKIAPRAWIAGAIFALAASVWSARAPTPALDSPPLANPALTLLSLREDRDFAVAVVDDGIQGERTLLTDGFRAAGTGRDYRYMQALGHLPLLLHPAPRRVAVLALGTGTTVGAVAMHPEVERLDVLEISRAVVDAAPFFVEKNHGALAEGLPGLARDDDEKARVVVRLGDGRRTLASSLACYDVITMEPLLPDSPFAVYLYTREFYDRARAALAPGGIVCQWIPPHALEPATFDVLVRAFARSFAWSGVWLYGTQVLLLGAEREPVLDARRFAARDSDLGRDLASLGLGSPADVLARWCANASTLSGSSATENAERPLTDADPWIVYRPRRRGPELLLDLPRNLARLRGLATDPSAAWLAQAGSGARERWRGFQALRKAREDQALSEARLRGAGDSRASGESAAIPLTFGVIEGDPEVVGFRADISFLDALRRGVSLLTTDRSRNGAELALAALIEAAEARPERADVHLYVAVALERLESPATDKALERALTIAPRLASTNEGRRARSLGLSDARWELCTRRASGH